MWPLITGIFQIILLVLTQIHKQSEEDRKRKEGLHAEAREAVLSGDASRITTIIDKLRK
jgi:hypothetical protein